MIHAKLLQLIAVPVYIAILLYGVRRKYTGKRQIINFLFFSYVVAVLSVTIFPLPIQAELIASRRELGYIENNFVPFRTIMEIIGGGSLSPIARILIANIFLFVPLGVLLPVLSNKISSLSAIVLWGVIGSVGIESLQFIISLWLGYSYRVTNIDDIILNTIGAGLGLIMLKLTFKLFDGFSEWATY